MKNIKAVFYILLTTLSFIAHTSHDEAFNHNQELENSLILDATNKTRDENVDIQSEGYQMLFRLTVLEKLDLPTTKFFCDWIESTIKNFLQDENNEFDKNKATVLNKELSSFVSSQGRTAFISEDFKNFLFEKKDQVLYRIMLLEKINMPLTPYFTNWITDKIESFVNSADTTNKNLVHEDFVGFCKTNEPSTCNAIIEFLENKKNLIMEIAFEAPAGVIDVSGKSLFEKFNQELKEALSKTHCPHSSELSIAAFNLAMTKAEFYGVVFNDKLVRKDYHSLYEKLCTLSDYASKTPLICSHIMDIPIGVFLSRDKIQYLIYQNVRFGLISADNIFSIQRNNPESCKSVFEQLSNQEFITLCMQQYSYLQVYNGLKNQYELIRELLGKEEESKRKTLMQQLAQKTTVIKTMEQAKALKSLFEEPVRKTTKNKKTIEQQTTIKAVKKTIADTKKPEPTVPCIPQTNSKPKLSAADLKKIQKEAYELQQQEQQKTKLISNKQLKKIKTELAKYAKEEENKRTSLITESSSSFTLITLLKKLSKEQVAAYSAIKNQEINGRKVLTTTIKNALQELEQAKQDDTSSTSTIPAEPLLSASQDLTSLHHTSLLSPIKQHNPYAVRVLPEWIQEQEKLFESEYPTYEWYNHQISLLHHQAESKRSEANYYIGRSNKCLANQRYNEGRMHWNNMLALQQERDSVYGNF